MLWTIMLLAVGVCGILGFYDSLFGIGDLMRIMNSGILVLLAIGLLARTWVKTNLRTNEKLIERNAELECKIEELSRSANNQKNATASIKL
jgi:hypothetical protein